MLVCGGAKVDDKLGVLRHLGGHADSVLVGGTMAEKLRIVNPLRFPVELPVDVVGAARFDAAADARVCTIDELPYGWIGLDIGPQTRTRFADVLGAAGTIYWNGPMGVFEWPGFAEGTKAVATAVAAAAAYSVVGGAAALRALDELGLAHNVSWASTGSGASLRAAGRQRASRSRSHPEPAGPVTAETTAYRLLLLRHGESVWNNEGLFTGWVDVGLSERGTHEAIYAGELLAARDLLPDVVHTSLLARAIRTTELALAAAKREWIPVRRSWRLNERHYGDLQGKSKEQTRIEYGDEQYMLWRRSYDVPPPPLSGTSEMAAALDPRYAGVPPDALPGSECLKDVVVRMLPYWYDAIVPDLLAGALVLVSAHGNSLRALVKHLDQIPDAEIAELNLPTGVPLLYELDTRMRPIGPVDPRFGVSGTYLDPDAAAASIVGVKNQGHSVVPR